jgi:hypothetical protein
MEENHEVNLDEHKLTFYKTNADGVLKNDDGSIKIFVAPRHSKLHEDLAHLIQRYAWDVMNSEELVEITDASARFND